MYGFGKEYNELDIRHLIFFKRAYKRVKLCPMYQKICKMLRSDMLSELGDNDINVHINYNLSGCHYPSTAYYWIMWAELSCGRSIRVVGESSRFCDLSRVLPIAGCNTPIGRYRKYNEEESDSEHDNSENESDEDDKYRDCFYFIPYYDYNYELYD